MNFIEAIIFCVVRTELSLIQLFGQLNVLRMPRQGIAKVVHVHDMKVCRERDVQF